MELNYDHEVKIKRDIITKIYKDNPNYQKILNVFDILSIPDKIHIFKVLWEDDNGIMNVNTGYRVQHNNCLGPYKGGLRFNKNVKLDTFKSLAFEQTFKNSLTGMSLGGGKGGSDFDPRGKSDKEIKRFCYAFTDMLYKYIGPEIDVPAGDIGVGSKEVGYMFGRYKQLTDKHDGAFTGKNVYGSVLRPEATGYGLIYFVLNAINTLKNENIIKNDFDNLDNKNILVSGFGNVAIHTVKKALHNC
jgi:glutamate dehydrogenase (NADP+)